MGAYTHYTESNRNVTATVKKGNSFLNKQMKKKNGSKTSRNHLDQKNRYLKS
jgi:hypothetical protein